MARAPRVTPQKSDGMQRRSYMNAYRKTEHMGLKTLGSQRLRDVSVPKDTPKDTRNYRKAGRGLTDEQAMDVDFGQTGFVDRNLKD